MLRETIENIYKKLNRFEASKLAELLVSPLVLGLYRQTFSKVELVGCSPPDAPHPWDYALRAGDEVRLCDLKIATEAGTYLAPETSRTIRYLLANGIDVVVVAPEHAFLVLAGTCIPPIAGQVALADLYRLAEEPLSGVFVLSREHPHKTAWVAAEVYYDLLQREGAWDAPQPA